MMTMKVTAEFGDTKSAWMLDALVTFEGVRHRAGQWKMGGPRIVRLDSQDFPRVTFRRQQHKYKNYKVAQR